MIIAAGRLRRCLPGTWWLLAILLSATRVAGADTLRVAVASNFAPTLEVIATRFETATGHHVVTVSGSTGKHYAQIVNGAPFDAFFAADTERPARLEAEGHALPGSRFTYALGKLVLWSPASGYVDSEATVLSSESFRFLAIANPVLAPYGRAARQVLTARGLWRSLAGRIVRGENIAQAYQFVRSGNAQLGFVAYSQIMQDQANTAGSFWLVPPALYAPIEQQAVALRESVAVRDLMTFVRSDAAGRIIVDRGYGSP